MKIKILIAGFAAILLTHADAVRDRKLAECVNVCAMFQQTAEKAIACAKKCQAVHDR
jgi:hypothetical protein